MQRNLYPKDWDRIATEIKESANWVCQQCGRPCRRPGEHIDDFHDRLPEDWEKDWWETVEDEEFGCINIPRPTRFVLTVAHLDHRPENCDRSNLRAWCSVCHLRYDRSPEQRAVRQRIKQEREGQLKLWI